MMELAATRKDINGLGKRVGDSEVTLGRHDERIAGAIKTNDEQWTSILELRADVKALLWKVGVVVGAISGLFNGATLIIIYLK